MEFKNRKLLKTRKNQDFDKDNIFIEKNGKKINVYAMIQENREDTEIYKVLEKYGCIDKIKIDEKDVYTDLTAIKDLRGIITQQKKADDLWKSLPLEFRKEFSNSKENFLENGEKYLKNIITQKEKKQKEIEERIKNAENNSNSELNK